ncbi:MAG: hypothetical protein LLF75_07205 [Eubacteriales bacterium]|nr:hypothetical protein [Eubacteriales bacterium]
MLAGICATKSGRMRMSACLALLLVGLTAAVFPITFLTIDDTNIMYTFAGYFTGEPFPIHGFVNLPLGYFTSLLYMWMPAVPWWPVLQLLCVSISIWVIFYSLWDIGAENSVPGWGMLLINALLYLSVLIYAVFRLSFTMTACMLGAAGVLRLLSADTGSERRELFPLCAMLESMALMIVCFLFRNSTGYSMVCFWAAGVAYHMLNTFFIRSKQERKRERMRLLAYGACCLAVFGALVWLNNWSYENMNPEGYAAFEDARGRYLDFPHVTYAEDPAFFASLGWDRQVYDLVDRSCFIDPHVTAENINAILDYSTGNTASLSSRFLTAMGYGEAFFRGNGPAEYMLVFPVLIGIWSLVRYLRIRKRGVETLIVLCLGLGSFALCLYLCFVERLILRAFQVIALPATVMMLALCMRIHTSDPLPEKKKTTVLRVMLILISLFSLGWSVTKNMLWIGQFQPQEQMQNMRTAESYAMEHKKNVYFCMPTFIDNREAFKTYPGERPTNLLDWGDTGMFSAWKTRQLEINGLNGLTPDVFRLDNVYLMGTQDGGELQVLIDYLTQDAGAKGCERVDTFGEGYAIYKVVY